MRRDACRLSRGAVPYFALFVPAIVFVSIWLVRLEHPRLALVVAFVAAAQVWLHYLLLPESGRVGLLGLGTAAWFFGTCAILDRCLGERRSYQAGTPTSAVGRETQTIRRRQPDGAPNFQASAVRLTADNVGSRGPIF